MNLRLVLPILIKFSTEFCIVLSFSRVFIHHFKKIMMFIRVPIEDIIPTRGELEAKIKQSEKKFINCLDSILQEVITELVNGVLILTEEKGDYFCQ